MRCVGLACLVVALGSSSARAETNPPPDMAGWDAWPYCSYGSPEISPPAGMLPANWPSFSIALTGAVTPAATRMTRMSDGHVVPLIFGPNVAAIDFAPTEPLVVGETYVVEHPPCATQPAHTTVYDVVAPDAEPAGLGTLVVTGFYALNFRRGACHREYYLYVGLSEDREFAIGVPWSSWPFWWTTEVDGGPPEYGNPLERYALNVGFPVQCAPSTSGLTPGPHTFVATASPWSDGRPISFTTPSLPYTIDCVAAVRVDAMTQMPLTPDQIAYWDLDVDGSCGGTPMDGAARSIDGGTSFDGAAHTEPDTHPNCGCDVARRPSVPLLVLLVVVAALGARARQRGRTTLPS